MVMRGKKLLTAFIITLIAILCLQPTLAAFASSESSAGPTQMLHLLPQGLLPEGIKDTLNRENKQKQESNDANNGTNAVAPTSPTVSSPSTAPTTPTTPTSPSSPHSVPAVTPGAGTGNANGADTVSATTVPGTSNSANAPVGSASASTKVMPLEAIELAQSNTEQLFIELTKPTVGETVFRSSYAICGVRNEDVDVTDTLVLSLAKYNEASSKYEITGDKEGNSAWVVGVNGIFVINVKLTEGDNKYALAVHRKADENRLTIANVQVIKFNIIYKGNNFAEKISGRLKEITVSTIIKEIEGSERAE